MTHKRDQDYFLDWKPDLRQGKALMYYGPNYNRICTRCNRRWAHGEPPKDMNGVELELERCGICEPKKRSIKTRIRSQDRERQLDRIAKFKVV